ncbi:hypothetical protein GOZ96_12245 [Agrobacterium vitis]|uniref:Uncharacterized protein n=1 Tax=Agrobacterium vitis TaxID=373 RepID=A0A368NP24_AGRVI|nr:hypothetical protein [Agrobacterium vitis]KAA3516983.1 hypothetical protein DXM22_11050 [Agrobacterium vitis]KAA3529748.1 hypothetical protein DXT89_08575 [Agrobacterium vitis]MUZ97372.1 hypothetical protein [Agrobacterium vitis]NOJ36250.1 hypothetical protein [Agrobacterium vitis]RCU52302.1 hypothetical protein ASB66_019410 [Agrobacterium vitis]
MKLEEVVEMIEEVKKKLNFDKRVSQNSLLAKAIERDEIKRIQRKNLENRFRNRGNPEVIRRIVESGILDE